MSIRPYQIIHNSSDLRVTADELGSLFFSRENMRFFRTRLSEFHYATPGGDSEGTQSGFFITTDKTTFGEDAPRGYRARTYTITRETREDGRAVDRIAFGTIEPREDNGLNGWFSSKSLAVAAIHAHIKGE